MIKFMRNIFDFILISWNLLLSTNFLDIKESIELILIILSILLTLLRIYQTIKKINDK